MTAKRFKVVNLRDYNICDIQDTSQEIPTFYNDLTYNFGSAKAICNLLNELAEENEQLKQFQDSVFSWIDMHLQRLPKLRDDEFESDNEFSDPSLYSGAIQILETMKREL